MYRSTVFLFMRRTYDNNCELFLAKEVTDEQFWCNLNQPFHYDDEGNCIYVFGINLHIPGKPTALEVNKRYYCPVGFSDSNIDEPPLEVMVAFDSFKRSIQKLWMEGDFNSIESLHKEDIKDYQNRTIKSVQQYYADELANCLKTNQSALEFQPNNNMLRDLIEEQEQALSDFQKGYDVQWKGLLRYYSPW